MSSNNVVEYLKIEEKPSKSEGNPNFPVTKNVKSLDDRRVQVKQEAVRAKILAAASKLNW